MKNLLVKLIVKLIVKCCYKLNIYQSCSFCRTTSVILWDNGDNGSWYCPNCGAS